MDRRILFFCFFSFYLMLPKLGAKAQAPSGQFNTDELFIKKDKKKKEGWFKLARTKKCPIPSCETQMIHTHNGKKYKHREWWRKTQNPKTGELVREPVTDPIKRKSSDKVRKQDEYQKEFKLPEKKN
jgi:hypothetical protein